MGYFNSKVLGVAMALLVLAFTSCNSKKPEGETSQTEQQTQESSMTMQEQEEQESSTAAQSPEQPSTTPEQEAAQVQEISGDSKVITVTGTVESGPGGIFISTGDGTYAISGRDLSDMAGMTVKVTGTLKESEEQHTIEVTDVVIVE